MQDAVEIEPGSALIYTKIPQINYLGMLESTAEQLKIQGEVEIYRLLTQLLD